MALGRIIKLREPQPLRRQCIQIRRADFRAVTSKIRKAEIIGHDQHNIRPTCRLSFHNSERPQRRQQKKDSFHAGSLLADRCSGQCCEHKKRSIRHQRLCGKHPGNEFFPILGKCRKSHSICSRCQNPCDLPKNAPNKMNIAGVMERRPSTISFTARNGSPINRAMAFCEIPVGLRYTYNRISPTSPEVNAI